MDYPDLAGVNFELCCQRTIQKMNEIIKRGNIAKKVTAGGIIVSIFIGPKKGGSIATLDSINRTDWIGLANAFKTIDEMVKWHLRNEVSLEITNTHSGNLGKFWDAMFTALM